MKFKPKYYIPVNGTLVQLFANAKIALGMNIGLGHNSVFVLDNGIIVEFDNYCASFSKDKMITGNVFGDGKGIDDIANNVLEERQKFSDGLIILAATISKSSREIVLGPDIQSRGLIFVKENDSLMKEIEKIFADPIDDDLPFKD